MSIKKNTKKTTKPGPAPGQPKFQTRDRLLKNVPRAWTSTTKIAEKTQIKLGNAVYHLQALEEDGRVQRRPSPDHGRVVEWRRP